MLLLRVFDHWGIKNKLKRFQCSFRLLNITVVPSSLWTNCLGWVLSKCFLLSTQGMPALKFCVLCPAKAQRSSVLSAFKVLSLERQLCSVRNFEQSHQSEGCPIRLSSFWGIVCCKWFCQSFLNFGLQQEQPMLTALWQLVPLFACATWKLANWPDCASIHEMWEYSDWHSRTKVPVLVRSMRFQHVFAIYISTEISPVVFTLISLRLRMLALAISVPGVKMLSWSHWHPFSC